MTKKEIMIKAHEMTKEIKNENPSVDYKFQLGLCLAYLHEEGEQEMIEFKTSRGTVVKIVLDGKLIKDLTVNGVELLKNNTSSNSAFISTFDNTIVLNDSIVYKKLGFKNVVKIAASNELIAEFKKATKTELEKSKAKREEIINIARENSTVEQFTNTFNKHMTNKNSF